MQRLKFLLSLTTLTACAGSTTPLVKDVTIVAERSEYSTLPGNTYATVTLDLRIINQADSPARLGCSFNIERARGSAFETVSNGSCSGPGNTGEIIPAGGEKVRTLSRPIGVAFIEESARYRIATSIAFGPDFSSGIAHKSTPFTLVRRD